MRGGHPGGQLGVCLQRDAEIDQQGGPLRAISKEITKLTMSIRSR